MDTQRRAPGMRKLAPSAPSSAQTPAQLTAQSTPFRAGLEGNDLTHQMVQTLRANLDHGFLENKQFRQIAETLQDIVFLTDADLSAIRFVNAAYEVIWGRSRADLYQHPMAFLEGVHPDDRERVLDALTRHPGSSYDIEFRVVRPDGRLRWVWTRGFPVRNANGAINQIAGIAEDITDRKQVLASHEQLIRGFTHDVKNPLGAADGYLSLLEMGVLGDLSPAQMETLERARRSIRTALDLVVRLLEIEMAQTGTLELHREHFDLSGTLHDVIDDHRSAAAARQLGLTLELHDGDATALPVYSDPTRVRQIVGNLVSNAVKYTQPGGRISVAARIADEAETPTRGSWFAIGITDNGPGIPLEKQHLLFREFTRLDPGAAAGSGIGLAISQQLALALDGRITVESSPGVGSAFTLWLRRVNDD